MNGIPWSPARDALLMELVSQELTFRRIAHRMRMTPNQVMGRFNRLRRAMGLQAV
jgi:hypothetical protein